jgi:hypothetical protein
MIFDFFKKKKDLEFVDTSRITYQSYPVMRASDVKPRTFEYQKNKYKKHILPHCPGMIQYAEMGYIIPAWIDIHIKANKAGVAHYIGSDERGTRGYLPGRVMDADVIGGLFEPEDNVPLTPLNFGSPWAIFGHGDITALLLPAVYHSDFLDDLMVLPGSVDYQKFHTASFICVPKRECEIHIKAGEPLLHVIPFWNKEFNAGFGPGSPDQVDKWNNEIPGDDKQYYRRYQMLKKVFRLSK